MLVEGREEVLVFRSIEVHLRLEEVEIRDYGGKDKLREFLRAFTARADFDDVRSLAIVADADFVAGASARRIRGALEDVGLPVPNAPLVLEKAAERDLTVSFLVLPHGNDQGMLEDVCLESVKANPVMKCVEQFMQCVRDERTDWPKQNMESKARVHAYLSSLDPPDLRLGEAAAGGHWNFDDSAFNPLKQLLQEL